MIELIDINNTRLIQSELGSEYSTIQKLKLGGTGSTKAVYVNGIEYFKELVTEGNSLSYVSFELFPEGIVLRCSKDNSTSGAILKKNEIKYIHFESRRIKVKTRIVHDSKIQIELINNESINLYCPTTFYKSMKTYWTKDWLNEKIDFTIDPADPVIDSNGLILDTISNILNIC